jgi:subtilisin-like proprotein convertase family protein
MTLRRWFGIGLLFALLVALFWPPGARQKGTRAAAHATQTGGTLAARARPRPAAGSHALLTRLTPDLASRVGAYATNQALSAGKQGRKGPPGFPYRLSNTSKGIGELSRSDTAILLRNAFIDTASNEPVEIPEHLRAREDGGSYIVQAQGAVDDAFRAQLAARGATIVSYVPNNAYLVRAADAGAQQLAGAPRVRAVLPYAPYYRLDQRLLALAVEQKPLPEGTWLSVVAFPGEREAVARAMEALGAKVKGEARSPFGPQFVIEPRPESLVALANLPGLQLLETCAQRVPLNDLTRVRLGVSTDSATNDNYLHLSGSNVWVNMNDTGVWTNHTDLSTLNGTNRLFGDSLDALTDLDGHGTHVAGVILGSGTNSSKLGTNLPSGSLANANFRGMAPQATLFSLPIDLPSGAYQSDTYLQETAARTNYVVLGRTNALVSNNSWGYLNQNSYDTAAASYDAAVRDALPDVSGSQPMVYVFAAGNTGGGEDNGVGGVAGTITSPGTAKNAITVGAIESFRNITYDEIITNKITNLVDGQLTVTNEVVTNKVLLRDTDSDRQVAAISSRGNVDPGIEGPFGRFKPDLVAPGTFVVSTRSNAWDAHVLATDMPVYWASDELVSSTDTNYYAIEVPDNAKRLVLKLRENRDSPKPFPDLTINIRHHTNIPPWDFSAVNRLVLPNESVPSLAPGTWYYEIVNLGPQPVHCDLVASLEITNWFGDEASSNYLARLRKLDEPLKPADYRYDTGTSASAAAVSGLLALIQEFFAERLALPYSPSPALLKALLINGARSLSPQYDFSVRNAMTYQGWGLVNLPTALPEALDTYSKDTNAWPVRWVEQNPTHALATGEWHAYDLTLPDEAYAAELRVTLAWTDPPANPNVAIKLVNDLDLVVSNKVTGEVYVGNGIPADRIYNAEVPADTERVYDNVNNVENVFVSDPLGTNYGIYVIARHVNVNALTSQTNGVAQDYALVLSISDQTITNGIRFEQQTNAPRWIIDDATGRTITLVTNGLPLLHERAGANWPLTVTNQVGLSPPYPGLQTPAGTTNQWHFYHFINSPRYSVPGITNGPYVAFITFFPPDLSRPRYKDADIDMYVTRGDARLTDLYRPTVAAAYKSLRRGGTEWLVFTNSYIGEEFYIGVKAEDQMAAEYGFVALSSLLPFEDTDENGNRTLRGFPSWVAVPDGSPNQPQAGLLFALGITPMDVSRVIVSNQIVHENLGDLLGHLSHGSRYAVLNNHLSLNNPSGLYAFLYDDSESGEFLNSVHTDGPGSLNDFIGEEGAGLWLLTMVDNSPGQTGLVQQLSIRLEPNPDLMLGVVGSVLPGRFRYYSVNVPPDATNLTLTLAQMSGALDLYLRRGALPTLTDYDKMAAINPPGGSLSLGIYDSPPLTAGRYYIGVFNPTASRVTFRLFARIDRDLKQSPWREFYTYVQPGLLDEATVSSTIHVSNAWPVAGVQVGVCITHPRVSDLVLHLVSPQGTRLLLGENRGGFAADFGTVITNTLVSPRTSSGGPEEDRNEIETGSNWGTVKVDYEYYDIPDTMHIYYDGVRIYDSGLINGSGSFSVDYGPGNSTRVAIVLNEAGNSQPSTLWQYTATVVTEQIQYTIFTEDTNRTTTPIKFAPLPFTPPQTTRVMSSSFEGIESGDFPAGTTVDGWRVESNVVAVVRALHGVAQQGSNYLSMIDSRISRTLPTVGGRTYWLRFAYREEVQDVFPTGVDDSRTVLPGGALDPHYWLLSGGRVPGPVWPGDNAFVVLTEELPSYWLKNTASSKWIAPLASGLVRIGPGTFVYRTDFDLRGYALASVKVVGQVSVDYELRDIRLNGRSTGIQHLSSGPLSPPFTLDTGFLPGRNALEFWCTNRSGPQGLRAEMRLSGNLRPGLTNRPADLILGGMGTNSLGATFDWQTNMIKFVAPTNGTELTLDVAVPGLRVDNFTLDEAGDTYYLPEEPLNPLLGQSAYGDWRLEVTDARIQGTNPAPLLVSWRLDLILVAPAPIVLTNGQCYAGKVGAGQMRHFAVDVPRSATLATNLFSSDGDLALYFNQNQLASGGAPGDVLLGVGASTKVLDTVNWPQLQPGQRYYLGVTNRQSSGTNVFTLCVSFDRTDDWLITLPELINGVMTINTIQPGGALDFYQYRVSDTAVAVTFELFPFDGNADLYVRKARAGPDTLPIPGKADFSGTNPGTMSERIDVTPDTTPPLSPGLWYMGVLNRELTPVTYGIRVTEQFINTNITIIDLTNNVPVDFGISTSPVITNFFRFVPDPTNAVVQFDLYNLSGPAELVVDLTNRPTSSSYLLHDFCSPEAPARIVVRTNALLPALDGEWYLAVINRGTNPLDFTICASLPPTNIIVIPLTNGVWFTNTISADFFNVPPALDYYWFTVSSNALFALFETAPVDGNVDIYLRKGDLPDLHTFDAYSENQRQAADMIWLRAGDPVLPLTPGDWYLAVYNNNPFEHISVTYRVRATEFSPNLVALRSGVALTNTISTNGFLDYYVFPVSDYATEAIFELLKPTGDVEFYVHRDLPLPGPDIYDCGAAVSAAQSASISITEFSPVPLAPGDWYLSVTNKTTEPVTYVVRATQCAGGCWVSLHAGLADGNLVLDWTAPAAFKFVVQYATNIPPAWVAFPGTVTSTDGQFRFVDDGRQTGWPAPLRLYRIMRVP